MSRIINIFVGGATTLKEERTYIKALTNDLNSGYLSKGIYIIAKSFEQFRDDRQGKYNDFIVNEADIAIFIIDGKLGPNTEEELSIATKTRRENHRPHVIVFMSDKDTPEMKEAKGIIKTMLEDGYYVPYKDLDDLKNQAKTRISMFALETDIATIEEERKLFNDTLERERNAHNVAIEKEKKKFNDTIENERSLSKAALEKKKRKIGFFRLLLGMAVLAILGLVLLSIKLSIIPEPLVFAGGGSVRNFIEDETGKLNSHDTIKVENYDRYYKNSISIPLPSGSAWRILQEEVQHNNKKGNRHKFHTICLSAGEMSESFKNSQDKIFDDKIISSINVNRIGIDIGNDTLAVYIHNGLFLKIKEELELKDNEITCKQLVTLLKMINNGNARNNRIATIYSTTETSGTLKSYFKAIKTDPTTKNDSAIIHQYEVFYDYTNSKDISKPFILLASAYYTVKDLKNKHDICKKLIVKNAEGPICKPTYLYFMAYEAGIDKSGECIYKIADPIIDFLKRLHLEPHIKDNEWDNMIRDGIVKDKTSFKASIILDQQE